MSTQQMFQAKFRSQAQHFPITSSNIPLKNDKAVNVNQLVSHVLDYQKPLKTYKPYKKTNV